MLETNLDHVTELAVDVELALTTYMNVKLHGLRVDDFKPVIDSLQHLWFDASRRIMVLSRLSITSPHIITMDHRH